MVAVAIVEAARVDEADWIIADAVADPKEPYRAPSSRAAPHDAMTAAAVRVRAIPARGAAHRVRGARLTQFDAVAQPPQAAVNVRTRAFSEGRDYVLTCDTSEF